LNVPYEKESNKQMKNRIVIVFCIIQPFLFYIETNSQNIQVNDQFTLNVAYNRFWQNDSTSFVEIATACYPRQVLMNRDSLGYHGNIELRITIQNIANGKIVQANRFHIPVHLQDTSAPMLPKSLLSMVTYSLEQGSYSVAVYGFDSGNIARCDSARFVVDILPRPSTVVLSDIELCTNITESIDKKDVFYKNSYRVIPNPSLVFGSDESPVVFTYSELYNLHKYFRYSIKVLIMDSKGRIFKERTRLRQFTQNNTVDITTLNITSLVSGKYIFQYILSDTLGHEITRAEKIIFIYNMHIQTPVATIVSAKMAEFAGMSDDELSNEFRMVKYLVTDDEIKTFSKIANEEGKRSFLAKLWSDIESGHHGTTGLSRTIYLDRVRITSQRFHTMGRDGWLTDRGRVFLLYGEPDEVQRLPNSDNAKPYEIWNYNQIESSVIFVFVDRTGSGDYILVHSTKRGEIQDEGWQRNLH
jgi:GWxTD domain-containing protein